MGRCSYRKLAGEDPLGHGVMGTFAENKSGISAAKLRFPHALDRGWAWEGTWGHGVMNLHAISSFGKKEYEVRTLQFSGDVVPGSWRVTTPWVMGSWGHGVMNLHAISSFGKKEYEVRTLQIWEDVATGSWRVTTPWVMGSWGHGDMGTWCYESSCHLLLWKKRI